MKNTATTIKTILFVLSACMHFLLVAEGVKDQYVKQVEQQLQEVLFLENKGQMTDMDGKPVPFVLYSVDAPGLDLYITEKGLTYVHFELQEDLPTVQVGLSSQPDDQVEGNPEKREKKGKWTRIDMELKGAIILKNKIEREGESSDDRRYFLAHCPDGIKGVRSYEKLTVKDIYPGIDWVLYNSNEHGFKYDFVVHPGADPDQIRMEYRSKEKPSLDKEGNLHLQTNLGSIQENAPVSYLKENKENVPTKFNIKESKSITMGKDKGFETEINFNTRLPKGMVQQSTLVIDPELVWGTFFGGNGLDGFMSIDTDENNNVFIAGYLESTNFPVVDGGGYFNGNYIAYNDCMFLKLDDKGEILWSTYYGGTGTEFAQEVKVDNFGNIYVSGKTQSSDFPVCTTCGGYYSGYVGSGSKLDAFFLKFDNGGNRLWGTYFGGNSDEEVFSLDIDANNNVYAIGTTKSSVFPTLNAYQSTHSGGFFDVFVVKFDDLLNLEWSTYLGGTNQDHATDLSLDNNGNVYITGYTYSTDFPVCNGSGCCGTCPNAYYQPNNAGSGDLFISKFSPSGALHWSTYYGGSTFDFGNAISVNANNEIYILGKTNSADFPVFDNGGYFQNTKVGGYDLFFLKFDNAGQQDWSTYYGGSSDEYTFSGGNIEFDTCGNTYFCFTSMSNDIYTEGCGSYLSITPSGGGRDNVLVGVNAESDIFWSTYFGGDGFEAREFLEIDRSGNIYLMGEWNNVPTSSTYPLMDLGGNAYFDPTFNFGNDDSFIAKFIPTNNLYLSSSSGGSGNCTCTATVTPNCGIGPYSYQWSNGQTTQTATNLCGGTYEVIVTDHGVCRDLSDTIEVTTCTTLGVDFIELSTKCLGDIVELTWQSYADKGENTIQIQRSTNGSHWETLHIVINKEGKHNYTYTDQELPQTNQPVYYRFYIDNGDGGYYTSEIVMATCTTQQGAWWYPNPTREEISLLLNSSYEGSVDILIRNPLGQLVKVVQLEHNQSTNTYTLDVAALPQGTYYAEVHLGDQVYNQKIIKK